MPCRGWSRVVVGWHKARRLPKANALGHKQQATSVVGPWSNAMAGILLKNEPIKNTEQPVLSGHGWKGDKSDTTPETSIKQPSSLRHGWQRAKNQPSPKRTIARVVAPWLAVCQNVTIPVTSHHQRRCAAMGSVSKLTILGTTLHARDGFAGGGNHQKHYPCHALRCIAM